MKVDQCCKRNVVVVDTASDVRAAAALMRQHHVGFLVVLDENNERRVPVGVITDRDIVVQIDANDVDPKSVKIGEVMTRNPIIATETKELTELVQAMRIAGVRRAPVVDATGVLTGVIAVDDAINLIAGLLCDVAGAIRNEQRIERQARAS
jgi:CBS domain-containing protein